MLWPFKISFYILIIEMLCIAEKIRFISTPNPVVTYINQKYLRDANLTTRQYGDDPFHYVQLDMDYTGPIPNNICVNFYFYEWQSKNNYKKTFLEMHKNLCDLVHKDNFFGPAMKQGKFNQPCPYPAGLYNLYNMTLPMKHLPEDLTFQKGRIYVNMTSTDTKELVASGHIDMEIKEAII